MNNNIKNKQDISFVACGIEFYDINEMLSDSVSAENWLFVDRAHLTDQGNMVVSERLYNMEQD